MEYPKATLNDVELYNRLETRCGGYSYYGEKPKMSDAEVMETLNRHISIEYDKEMGELPRPNCRGTMEAIKKQAIILINVLAYSALGWVLGGFVSKLIGS